MTNERDKNEYSKDELIPPAFLNKHFFEDVLRDTENDKDLEVKYSKLCNFVKLKL